VSWQQALTIVKAVTSALKTVVSKLKAVTSVLKTVVSKLRALTSALKTAVLKLRVVNSAHLPALKRMTSELWHQLISVLKAFSVLQMTFRLMIPWKPSCRRLPQAICGWLLQTVLTLICC
jgi:hypothetical protein